jgi:predicted Zn-dependent protease
LQAAGYDVTQAPVTFEFLLAEVEALDIDEAYFFSTHPGLRERIDSFKELVRQQGTAGGYRGEEAYQAHIGALRERLLAEYLQLGQYQSVLLILTRKDAFTRYPPSAWYYLGEAYRLRDDEGDEDRAVTAYQTAVARVPAFAPPYRALGLHYMKAGQTGEAVSYFSRYLELAPEAPDRAYIEMYRSQMK